MSAALASSTAAEGRRTIVVAVLMASFMQSVTLSIPNAALLYLQGTLSMADDEVGWVFTSYIAASVVTMPMTRWLAGRYGRKTIYLLSIAIFAVGLVLAARATTPMQFVAARIIQGGASGPLAPLSIAILLDILPPPQHARINLVVAVTLIVGILSGPSIGGWLAEYHGWPSMFYLVLLVAGFIFLAMWLSLPEKRAEHNPSFDFFGWVTLTLGIIGLQMLFDRGERLEWFNSTEIWVEAIASALGFYLFLVHVLTMKAHFLDNALFKDRNFVVSTILYFVFGFVLLPTIALTSPMLDEILKYPADTTGYMAIPRSIALVGALILGGPRCSGANRQPPARDRRHGPGHLRQLANAGLFTRDGLAAGSRARACCKAPAWASCCPRSPRRRSARSIRDSARKAPRSSICRASTAARSASRWSCFFLRQHAGNARGIGEGPRAL